MTSTEAVTLGTMRLLQDMGYAALTELPLRNGRRADLVGVSKSGTLLIAEVKSCLEDFRSDKKWQNYLPYCDVFYFSVDASFPMAVLDEPGVLPERTGIIVADAYGGEVMREAAISALHPARRKSVHLQMACAGADRLMRGNLQDAALPGFSKTPKRRKSEKIYKPKGMSEPFQAAIER